MQNQIEANIQNKLPVSTEQIVKITNEQLWRENKQAKSEEDSSEEEDDDDDSDLYVAFDSDDDEKNILEKIKNIKREKQDEQVKCGVSATTKSSKKASKPLIEELE